MIDINTIILAAGKGSRMESNKPKVLQLLSGKTLLHHVLLSAKKLSSNVHIVYGYKGDLIRSEFKSELINWVEQSEQLGTGHAVTQAMPGIKDDSISLILYGDVPLIKESTLYSLTRQAEITGVALLSVVLDNPSGYGRIIRHNENIQAIVEQKDASPEQLKILEVNTGIMAVNTRLLKIYLNRLTPDNAQGELYLTDIVEMAVNDGVLVSSVIAQSKFEVAGVNDKKQLADLERYISK